jgi:hypothetical protein
MTTVPMAAVPLMLVVVTAGARRARGHGFDHAFTDGISLARLVHL